MRFPCPKVGRFLILLGLALLLALVLPKDIWPFLLAALLIGAGVCILRK